MHKRMLVPVFLVVAAMAACRNPGFEWVDLQGLAYQADDLPQAAGTVAVRAVEEGKDWKYLQWINLQLIDPDGGIRLDADVILFSDKKELAKAYQAFTVAESQKGYAEYEPPEIGYAAVGRRRDAGGGNSEILFSFQRCYAMVNIWACVGGESALTEEDVYRYAEGLDARLNNSVCPI
jgi:hypothetical protein